MAAALGLLALATAATAQPRVIDLLIRDGEIPKEQRLIRVQQGDDVTIRLATDKPVTVHLHGYDIEKGLAPGPAATIRFIARATGRFPIAVHAHGRGGERTLGYLEVHPR